MNSSDGGPTIRNRAEQHLGRVLHVATLPPPVGGMTTYFKGLLESDVSNVFAPLVVRSDQTDKYSARGLKRKLLSILNTPLLAWAVCAAVLRYRPAIVHIQANSGAGYFEKSLVALLARLLHCKVLMHMHGGGFMEYYQRASNFKKRIIWRCIQLNDYMIAPSKKMRETFLTIGIPPERIKLLENAVSLPPESIWDFRCEEDEQKKDGMAGPVTVLFLNSITQAKGVFELIDAAQAVSREFPRVRFRIAGVMSSDGEAVKKRIAESAAAGQIDLIGPVTDEEKERELRSADLYVLPSHVEDLPYGLLEAMACGLPCVASAVGGIPSLIEEGTSGLLIPVMNVTALAGALRRLVTDQALRRRIGTAGRLRVKEFFGWPRRAKEIIEFYKSLLV